MIATVKAAATPASAGISSPPASLALGSGQITPDGMTEARELAALWIGSRFIAGHPGSKEETNAHAFERLVAPLGDGVQDTVTNSLSGAVRFRYDQRQSGLKSIPGRGLSCQFKA